MASASSSHRSVESCTSVKTSASFPRGAFADADIKAWASAQREREREKWGERDRKREREMGREGLNFFLKISSME
jgi:uncharacterized protein (DUF1919 family)